MDWVIRPVPHGDGSIVYIAETRIYSTTGMETVTWKSEDMLLEDAEAEVKHFRAIRSAGYSDGYDDGFEYGDS